MALSKTTMAATIIQKIKALFPDMDEAQMQPYWEAVADGIITRIKADMVVSSTVAVTSVSGITVGAQVSGPGTGNATSSTIV